MLQFISFPLHFNYNLFFLFYLPNRSFKWLAQKNHLLPTAWEKSQEVSINCWITIKIANLSLRKLPWDQEAMNFILKAKKLGQSTRWEWYTQVFKNFKHLVLANTSYLQRLWNRKESRWVERVIFFSALWYQARAVTIPTWSRKEITVTRKSRLFYF